MTGERGYSRREFLRTSAEAGAVLIVAVHLPLDDLFAGEARGQGFHPAAWVKIDADGIVSVVIDEAELGQGVMTSLPMIVAEELGADWSKVRPLPPPTDPSTWVRTISTGGSTSMRQAWQPLRQAAATAREMLRTAAAQTWNVPVEQCRADNGAIVHGPSGRRIEFGALVERAAQLPVPEDPPMKPASEYRLLGTSPERFDMRPKLRGEPVFGSDVVVPGMVMATVARPPAFGATLSSVDDSAARRVDGVLDVVTIPQGVAVVARNTWAALKGRDALRLEWDTTPARGLSSGALHERLAALGGRAGTVMREAGEAEAAFAAAPAARRVDATYRLPFLDHAPMEAMMATAHVKDGRVEVWVPTQVATASQRAAARVAGVEPGAVTLHATLAGGGFGRRLQTDDTEIAVEIAKRVDAPVQVFWTRQDSIRNGAYRPLTQHRLRGAVDAAGAPVAWLHRAMGVGPRNLVATGAESPPYDVPNFLADMHLIETPVPLGALRSVSYTHMGFIVETFIDELAALAGQDPFEYRRAHMNNPRLRAAMELAAAKAGWGSPLPAGRARGIAAVSCFSSHAAEVVELSVEPDGSVRVHRVVCGVHCGRVIDPDNLLAQVQGAVAIALSFTLKHEITLEDGAVQQSNFHDYPIVRMDEMPVVEVYPVPTEEPPTGIGEPPVAPLAAAIANAVFAATGRRVRSLPITPELVRPA
jgi:isoquinoline 1-oxidoreductase subunit beta